MSATTASKRFCYAVLAALTIAASPAGAEVTRVSVTSRTDAGNGYDKVSGQIYFSVDPRLPQNAAVADIDKAQTTNGRVEFSSRFYALVPRNGGNKVALVDIVNRGRKTVAGAFSVGAAADPDLGDGLLTGRGFTIVGVGWEFDVKGDDLITIQVPSAQENGRPIRGVVRATMTPNAGDTTYTFGDLAGYTPAEPNGPESRLTWRAHLWDAPNEVPRNQWRLSGNTVTATPALEPGRIYELSYTAEGPPIAGLGLVAVRDTVAWMKHAGDTLFPAKSAYAYGASQSGRFLRTLVYEGFNRDEQGRQVFDALMIHIAGAARLTLNRRWATPTSLESYAATAYPFADRAERDPLSGASEGLLDNPRARSTQPKIIYTNTGVEYWGGGRTAALTHIAPEGTRDIDFPGNVRSFFLAGTQHTPSAFPPPDSAGQQKANPINWRFALRSLLVALDDWTQKNVPPPASMVPRLDRGTLVAANRVRFPALPGVASPQMVSAGKRAANPLLANGSGEGAALPLLVPQVDADGNEVAGVRLPDLSVPLATYTGWNFRKPADGASDQLVPLLGSYIPFAATRADREGRHDPRRGAEERYPSRASYIARVKEAADDLVRQRLLLATDVNLIVARAQQTWDLVVGQLQETSTAADVRR
jgi:hypothetical protein